LFVLGFGHRGAIGRRVDDRAAERAGATRDDHDAALKFGHHSRM